MRVDISPNNRKFRQGDIVKVAKELPPIMAHFRSDCLAIVDHYCNSGDSLGLILVCQPDEYNEFVYLRYSAWYGEELITLVEDDLYIQGKMEVLLEEYHRR